jgi:eukaryotic-like serine/threonine-protein kinase
MAKNSEEQGTERGQGASPATEGATTSAGSEDASVRTATSIRGEDDESVAPSHRVPTDLLEPGAVVGSYTVTRLVGRGGMGAVYEAKHRELGKRAAIKTLLPEHAAKADVRKRFLREGQASSKIRHAHVVDVYDVGEQDEVPYLIMEYLEGEDLGSLLAREGALPAGRVADLMIPVLSALVAAHDIGVVHRDLKPDNIFLCQGRGGVIEPKVVDFGISKIMDESETHGLTGTSTLMGTPYYMSPEQAKSAKNIDARSDQLSMAAILYEALVGQRPFAGETLYTILDNIVRGQFPPPRTLNPSIPEAFEAAILRAMSVDPDNRFQSVRALAQALLPFAGERVRVLYQDELAGPDEPKAPGKPVARAPGGRQGSTLGSSVAAIPAGGAAARKGISPLVVGVGAAVVLVVAGGGWLAMRSPGEPVAAGSSTGLPTATSATAAVTAAPAASTPVTPASSAASAAAATRMIESTPSADVYVAGKLVGKTPFSLELPAGTDEVEVELRARGFAPQVRKVSRSDPDKVNVELQATAQRTDPGTKSKGPTLAPR